ncbi:probable 18S rRNA (guanine-N(7))-methyltransferase [Temnothorax curvispinosus]|uniref:Probable 18S rRNA (Guanine-N(7))-methyltransferase n=1 Tax=Temnothorax curvispinosus TaxID=300111 RepID=A0A6J1QTW2_9HYME|nr:probable 18S rRNA (guanine-N(7))-methyltransferase [Temnothorax curvispinosus]
MAKKALERPYTGPHKVVQRISERVLNIDINGITKSVSVDLLKPAYFVLDDTAEPLSTSENILNRNVNPNPALKTYSLKKSWTRDVAVDERELDGDGDLILGDIGQGLPFKTGTFDGAVSISTLQWLCYASKTLHNPTKRLYCFFSTLYACLSRSARAVLQFYPENGEQVELITAQATKAGFYGGVVVDFPNSAKAKKMVLVLMTGGVAPLLKALGVENEDRQTVVIQEGNT